MIAVAKKFLYAVPFTVAIVCATLYYPYIGGKALFFRFIIEATTLLIMIAWAQGDLLFKENIRHRSFVVTIGIFLGIFIIATLFGIDPKLSFWSSFERMDGVFQMIHYGILFFLLILLFKKEHEWQKIFFLSVIAGLLVILAVPIITTLHGAPQWDILFSHNRFIGSLGNASYVGSYFLFSFFYIGMLTIHHFQKRKSLLNILFLGICTIIFLIFLILTQTRGAVLGLGAGIMATLFFLLFSGQKKVKSISQKILLSIIGISVLISAGSFFLPKNYCPICQRFITLSPTDNTNKPRILIWQTALESIKDHPLLGWGPENFYAAFNARFNPNHFNPQNPEGSEIRVDRPHNIYLQYFVDAGIIGFLSFIALFVILYKDLFTLLKKKNVLPVAVLYQAAIIFGFSIAYLVSAFFSVEALPTTFNLFIFFAFCSWFFYHYNQNPDTI
ncbi:MAG: O-antigen ligase family protein [bacterium]